MLGSTLVNETNNNNNNDDNKYLLANTEFEANAFITKIEINATESGLVILDVREEHDLVK